MALRVRFQYPAGASLGYSIERLSDGLLYDFAIGGTSAGTFTANAATPIAPLPADSGNFSGRYKSNLSPTPPSQFADGDYCVTIHDQASGNAVVAELTVVMHGGDDATVIPSNTGGSAADPWAQSLPGSYGPGTAGYALGTNLDAKVSSRLAGSSYVAPPTDYQQRSQPVVLPATAPSWYTPSTAPTVAQIVSGVWDEPRGGHVLPGSFGTCLDAAVSSRLAASADTPGTATLLGRLSASRAAYLDVLNVSGPVATRADVASIPADFNATDRANLNSLVGMAGTTGVVVASASKTGYSLSGQEHAAITADAVAALNTAIPAAPTAGSAFDRLDARVSSRSIYAGGPVASVAAPVVVGQNNDKAGYSLSASGFDAVQVEPGINARQALSPILAATAGVLSGAGTGTITIRGGNAATTRISATTDTDGNRTAVVLTLPS